MQHAKSPRRRSSSAARCRRMLGVHPAVGMAGACAAMLLGLPAARAITDSYTGVDGGFWSVASNWTTSSSTHVVPANGDDAVLGTPAGISSVNFNASYSAPGLNSLTINAVSVTTFTLNQTNAGTAMVAVNETLGTNEYGNIYNQTAGTDTVTSTLSLGTAGNAMSQGTYELSGTGILNAGSEVIGASGSTFDGGNQFLQTGGTNNVSSGLGVGNVSGGSGSYLLSGTGQLNVSGNEAIGSFGSGTFNQTGGTNAVSTSSTFFLGAGGITGGVGNGFYSLSGPVSSSLLSAGSEYVGDSSTATFNQSGGTNTCTSLNLSINGGSTIYNLSAGNVSSGILQIGGGGNAAFNQSGGNVNVGALFYLFSSIGGVPKYTLSGGNFTVGSATGSAGVAQLFFGVFNQTAGTVSLVSTSTTAAQLEIAPSPSANSIYLLSGIGTLMAGAEQIGVSGIGSFNQTGGTNTLSGSLQLAVNQTAVGNFLLSAGSLTVNNGEMIGSYGTGTLNQTGGTHTVAGGDMLLGQYNGASGTYLLSGGSLNASANVVVGSAGVGTFNQTGGTLTVGQYLTVGSLPGSVGTCDLTNANASAGSLELGYFGTGTINQFSGNFNVSGFSSVAYGPSSTGTYNLYNGSLGLISGLDLGFQGNATINQFGGFISIGSDDGSALGQGAGSTGIYNLKAGTFLSPTLVFVGGYTGPCTGVINQSGGTFNNGNSTTYLAQSAGSTGIYNLTGGNAFFGTLDIGQGGVGTFNQSGSSSNLSAGNIYLGYQLGSTGVFNLSAGNVSAGAVYVGYNGSGALNMTGGNLTAADLYAVFDSQSGTVNLSGGTLTVTFQMFVPNNGSFFLSGSGILNLTGTLFDAQVGPGNGVFTQTGGTINGNIQNYGFFNWSAGAINGQFENTFGGVANFSTGFLLITGGIQNDGILNIAGNLGTPASQTFFNDGTINVTAASAGIYSSGPVVNDGTINLNGYMDETGGFTNNLLLNQGPDTVSLQGSGAVSNYGTFNLASGHALVIYNTVTNYGLINVNGALVESEGGTLTNGTGGFVNGPGTITAPFTNSGTVLPGTGSLYIQSNWNNSGSAQLTASSSGLTGGTITNTGTISGFGTVGSPITNIGTIQGQGGTLLLEGAVTNPIGGLITAGTGGEVQVTSGLATNAGIISLTGGTFDNGGAALLNTGQITGYGTLRTGGLTNAGHFTLSGTSSGATTTVTGNVTNNIGQLITIEYQPAIFTGSIVNNGTFVTVGTTVTFAGSYSGNAYISDPSTNIFQSNVTIAAGGSMTGTVGDNFSFFGGLVTNNGSFNNSGSLISADNFINNFSFIQTGSQSWSALTSFNNTAGTATFGSDAGAGGQNLTVDVLAGSVLFTTTQHLTALNISAGAVTTLTGGGNNHRSVLFTPTFSDIGTLNLTANDLDVQNGGPAALTALTSLIQQGYSNGTWTGTGITSSSAATDSRHLTALGVILNTITGSTPLYTSFDGATVANNDVLVKLTWYGDANLDGKIDGSDYSRIDNGALLHLTGWFNGDFNYDGVINGSDYTLIDNAFNTQGASLSAVVAGSSAVATAQIAGVGSAVPEPVGLALLLAPAMLVRRRRRV